MAGERILIVEDEFLILATLSEVLEDEGFEIATAESGEAALEIVRGGGVALLMTDMKLAGVMDGAALAAASRDIKPGLPVIYMTGRPDLLPRPDGLHEAVLAKPYSTTAVGRLIRQLLG